MAHQDWNEREAQRTLERLLPRIEPMLRGSLDIGLFQERLDREFPRLFGLLLHLYGNQYDFFYQLEQILLTAAYFFAKRPADLKELDRRREAEPLWFRSEQMLGGVCYVDLFGGDLEGIRERIPYFKELGLTYLHLMPLFKVPETNNDGGYAVSSYREVNPKLGTMEQLSELSEDLRDAGISLVLDFVFNHTSNEHLWAQRALAGDEDFQNYYYMFPDRYMPDQYEHNLREIFPDQAPGSFTYDETMRRWVWTTFYNFQWDLNYRNPQVFNAMLGELLFLANQGVEVIRLDAVAFTWKQLGTSCENLPEAHMLIQAYNALVQIVAPGMLFKSEAIVHPRDVNSYISWGESQLSYNPTLMALLWEALATRKVTLLQHSMARRFTIPENTAWVNYIRVHDDIGWTFADEDAGEIFINGYDHRQFLNNFYLGGFEGSFSVGLPFGYNPVNQDVRICGTAASLAGLEQAADKKDGLLLEYALRRLLLIHSVIISAGGIPLLYLGDEIGMMNDYGYRDDPQKARDNRWVHRPAYDWERWEQRTDPETVVGQLYQGLHRMISV
ncbi:MAG: alpha-amylase family protein, partial [Anaerolineae bacterium]|nr:alpha-amylase family protein [Anaerolineae bacterium]